MITTDWSATISPANDGACEANADPDRMPGAKKIAATTTARNAPNFTTVVISWKRLLTRSPASCNAASAASASNGDRLLVPGKRRHQQRRELADRDRHVSKHRAVGDPIGPSDREAHRVAEGSSRIHVIPARLGQHRPQLGQADGAEQRIQAAHDPDRENRRGVRELTGDEARRSQNADPERAADDDSEAEADAENADETARSGWSAV